MPNIISTLHTFQEISGLGVNLSKCSALLINFPQNITLTIQSNFGFAMEGQTLPYLGIKLAPTLHKLYLANYSPAFTRIRHLLHTWSPYHITSYFWAEFRQWKCQLSLSYYFFFFYFFLGPSPTMCHARRSIQFKRDVNNFVWQNKKPQLGRKMIYRLRAMGGLGLPNLWLYYLSARLLQLAQWHNGTPPPTLHTHTKGIPWLRFKRTSIAPYFLPGLLWATSIHPKDISTLNAVVGKSLHLWSLYKKKLSLLPSCPSLASFEDPTF